MDKISLNFDGYWREVNETGIPKQSGVYCVYACKYNPPSGSESEGTVSIRKLLYVGESTDVRDRIINHDRRNDWKRHLKAGETLCFTFASINYKRVQAEAAIINRHKPIENTEFINSFPYPSTEMSLNGKIAELSSNFTVTSTKYSSLYY